MRMNRGLRLALTSGLGIVLATVLTAASALAKPGTEQVYANGQTFTMLTPHAMDSPSPNLLNTAPPFYVMAFPMTAEGQPILPPGYTPQCDPCLGVPVPPYHDHLLTSAPGFGQDGTARDYRGPWRVVVMMYSPAYVLGGGFTPVTSDEDLGGAEGAGHFLPIAGSSAPNPFERRLPVVLVCPIVSDRV